MKPRGKINRYRNLILRLLVSTLVFTNLSAQSDSLKLSLPNEKYLRQIYNPETQSINSSYDYSGLWDIDGDKIKDSVFFIGNGGAHVYYYPKVILSSNARVYEYPSVNVDLVYIDTIVNLKSFERSPATQFVVYDFDSDGIPEFYLNADNDFTTIPGTWKNKGVKTKCVILDFSGKTMVVKDYPFLQKSR